MSNRIHMVGAPYSYGSAFDGTKDAPDYLRTAGLIELLESKNLAVVDGGNIDIGHHNYPDFLSDRLALSRTVIKSVYRRTLDIYSNGGGFPLMIGGDHSITAGAALATQRHFGKIGLISIDRHSDLYPAKMDDQQLEPSIDHANFLRVITNVNPLWVTHPDVNTFNSIDPENTSVIGVNNPRDLDPHSGISINKVMMFPEIDIEIYGAEAIARKAITRALDGTNGIYLSFDIDALNSQIAPGADFPGGPLDLAQAKTIVSMIAKSGRLLGADLVEIDPYRDENGATFYSAIEIIEAMFKK